MAAMRAWLWPGYSALLFACALVAGLFFRGQDDPLFAVAIIALLLGVVPPVLAAIWRGQAGWPRDMVPVCIGAFWLYITISLSWSSVPYVSLVTWLMMCVLPISYFGPLVARDPARMIRAFMVALYIIMAVLAVGALVQVGMLGQARASYPFTDANKLAVMLNLGLLPVMAIALSGRRWAVALAFLLFAGLLATESRAGMIAFILSSSFLLAVQWRGVDRRSILLSAGGFAMLFCIMHFAGAGGVGTRMAGLADFGGDMAAATRPALWGATWGIAKDHVWTGTGLGTFFMHYGAYRTPDDLGSTGQFAHSDPLQFWAEMGVAAPLLFYALCAAVFVLAIRGLLRVKDLHARAMIAGPTASLLTLFIHCHVSYPLYILPVLMVAGLWLGCLQIHAGRVSLWPEMQKTSRSGFMMLTLALVIMIGLPTIKSGVGVWYVTQAKNALRDNKPGQFIALLERAERAAPGSFADPKIHMAGLYIQLLRAPDVLFPKDEQFALYQTTQDALSYAQSVAEPWAEIDYRFGWLYNTVRTRFEPDWQDKAVAALQSALQKDKRHVRASLMLSDLYVEIEDKDKARTILENALRYPYEGEDYALLKNAYERLDP